MGECQEAARARGDHTLTGRKWLTDNVHVGWRDWLGAESGEAHGCSWRLVAVHEESPNCFLGDGQELAESSASDSHAFIINEVPDIPGRKQGGNNTLQRLAPSHILSRPAV